MDWKNIYLVDRGGIQKIIADNKPSEDAYLVLIPRAKYEDKQLHLLVYRDDKQGRYVGRIAARADEVLTLLNPVVTEDERVVLEDVIRNFCGLSGLSHVQVVTQSQQELLAVRSFDTFEAAARQASILTHGDELDVIKIENGDP